MHCNKVRVAHLAETAIADVDAQTLVQIVEVVGNVGTYGTHPMTYVAKPIHIAMCCTLDALVITNESGMLNRMQQNSALCLRNDFVRLYL